MYRNTYTLYNSKKAVEDLDTNRYNPYRATIFPYGVYTGAILPVDDYICGQAVPRDTSSHYIIDRERVQHPDKFSRFGYARNFYGYTVGNWTNRTSDLSQTVLPPTKGAWQHAWTLTRVPCWFLMDLLAF